MGKIKIEKNTVSETLVIPLYGRAHCSKKYPEVFSEPEAERIVDMVDYDFSVLNYKEFMMMTWAVRKRLLCDKAREYLKKHPKATLPKDMREAKTLPRMSKFILNMGMKMKMIQIVEILFAKS